MVQVTPKTSRPPVRVATSVSLRRGRVPPAEERSMFAVLNTPPACRGADVAWCREASTSGPTMSLSVARPILMPPAGTSGARPGRRILSMLVARLPSLVRGAAVGPICVTDSRPGEEIGCATAVGRTGCGVLGEYDDGPFG